MGIRHGPPLPAGLQRNTALDAVRGLAVILMLNQHIGVWFWKMGQYDLRTVLRTAPLMVGLNALGGLAAPIFVILSGMGASFLPRRRPGYRLLLLRRGSFLLGLGYLLNLLVPSWFSPGSWYVLHLIGASLALSTLIVNRSALLVLSASGAVLAATPLLQYALKTPAALSNADMGTYGGIAGIARLAFVEGHFPVFPWFALFCLGIVAGRMIAARHYRGICMLAISCVVLGGGAALANTLFIHAAAHRPAFRFIGLAGRIYPLYPPLACLLSAGVLLLVIAAAGAGRPKTARALRPCVDLGRCSLTVFIVHILLFRQAAIATGIFRRYSAWTTGLMIAAVAAGTCACAAWWRRRGYRYGLEWLMRRVCG